jgi:hypothetical protein
MNSCRTAAFMVGLLTHLMLSDDDRADLRVGFGTLADSDAEAVGFIDQTMKDAAPYTDRAADPLSAD